MPDCPTEPARLAPKSKCPEYLLLCNCHAIPTANFCPDFVRKTANFGVEHPLPRKKYRSTLVDIGRHWTTFVPLSRQNGRISLPGDNGAGQPPCQPRQYPVYGTNGRTNQGNSERLRTSNRSVSQGELHGKWKRPDWDQELSHSALAGETTQIPECSSCQKPGQQKRPDIRHEARSCLYLSRLSGGHSFCCPRSWLQTGGLTATCTGNPDPGGHSTFD